jgi:outer membrane protein
MRTSFQILVFAVLLNWIIPRIATCQESDGIWTLQKCISRALDQNLQIKKTILSNEINLVDNEKAKAERFPSASASVSQNFSWSKPLDQNFQYGNYSGTNGTNFSVGSNVKLYNGFRINNTIRQSKLNYQVGEYNTETVKENISLNVVDAYLQILYAEEQVKNSQNQVLATDEQLRLAGERLQLGAISQSDFLQIKSQLASEKLTLANAENLLIINKVTLMQLMEQPVSSDFSIEVPRFGEVINQNIHPVPDSIFNIALNIKPQIKSANINVESAKLDVSIARSGFLPVLALNSGIGTGYSSKENNIDYGMQVKNGVNPYVGLTLSIPIYQNRQVKSNVEMSKIGIQTAELNLTDAQNQLRKTIEQVCVDVNSAEKDYDASIEQYNSMEESFNLSTEKFNEGLINSVDYLVVKTNMIAAESKLLQSKYNLIFNYKILDFYLGKPIIL